MLDRERALPVTRLWCLYEMGSTPQDRLQLVTTGFAERDLANAFATIDVDQAHCFDPQAEGLIRREIERRYGSIAEFTAFLRLRFLLRPLRYDADIEALLSRSADAADSGPVRAFLRLGGEAPSPAADDNPAEDHNNGLPLLACVLGDSGEGKSTLSAAFARDPAQWLHAVHFCKHSDSRRQDPALVIKSLAYQLARRFPAVKEAILALDTVEVARLQQADECLETLLVGPLRKLGRGQRVAILIDALDEARVNADRHRSQTIFFFCVGQYRGVRSGGGAASPRHDMPPAARPPCPSAQADPPDEINATALNNPAVRLASALHGALAGVVPLSLLVTTRPEPPHIVRALESRWGQEAYRAFAPHELRHDAGAEAGAAGASAATSKILATVSAGLLSKLSERGEAEKAADLRARIASNGLQRADPPAEEMTPATPAKAARALLRECYEEWFELDLRTDSDAKSSEDNDDDDGAEEEWEDGDVKTLLSVLASACEPPSLSLLEALGAR